MAIPRGLPPVAIVRTTVSPSVSMTLMVPDFSLGT